MSEDKVADIQEKKYFTWLVSEELAKKLAIMYGEEQVFIHTHLLDIATNPKYKLPGFVVESSPEVDGVEDETKD